MQRRTFLLATAAVLAASRSRAKSAEKNPESLADLAAAIAAGRSSAVSVTQSYLDRIARLDRQGPTLKAVIETNPKALEIAAALDAELKSGRNRGPLHGVPVLIKDNIETADHMMSTAGSLALEGWYCPSDAPLVERLRKAGAVILGKTNLSEWANFRSSHAVSGWSARGGQTLNPHALDRSPSGSSSGSAVAVAAELCAVAVGTETDGSIVGPASANGVVGLKPTVGLVSRRGIAPISHSQDTAGPLARNVADAALLLNVMAWKDPADAAGAALPAHPLPDYLRFVDPDGLKGARLGIARKFFQDNTPLNAFLDTCVALLKDAGATLVDGADLPLHGSFSAAEQEVLLYEFHTDLNKYLGRLKATQPVRSLEALIQFNEAHREREMPFFDQELLLQARDKGPLSELAYTMARDSCLKATRSEGIDKVLAEQQLDAMISLTSGPAWLIDPVNGDTDVGGCSSPAAVAGYPHITVPAGLYRGLPVGLSFFAGALSEPRLIRLASGFEHVAGGRPVPRFSASVKS